MDREERLSKVADLLRTHWEGTEDWGEISKYSGKTCPKRVANTFLVCCLLDYQIKADRAWENGRRLVHALKDPDDIWAAVTAFSEEEWESKFKELGLHRYPAAHKRLWRIGREICSYFDGDANKIWQNSSAFDVLCRLNYIGAGEQISRMIVGALRDVGQIQGKGDVKADVHVCRVIGRVFFGEQAKPETATELTRQLSPDDPWQVDRTLWKLGSTFCHATTPDCSHCYLSAECMHAQTHSG
jgi:endonuclease III